MQSAGGQKPETGEVPSTAWTKPSSCRRPPTRKNTSRTRASRATPKAQGAPSTPENRGDDVPDGKAADARRAVQAKPDATVEIFWITWPDKTTREAGWKQMVEDCRMQATNRSFDGKGMIFGGF
jgi:uncharacterized protein YbaA (DUF1428 family)